MRPEDVTLLQQVQFLFFKSSSQIRRASGIRYRTLMHVGNQALTVYRTVHHCAR